MMRWAAKLLHEFATMITLRLGFLVVKILPRRFVLAIARAAADLGYYLFRRFRTRSIRNLVVALGDQLDARQIADTVRRSLRNFFRAFVELSLALDTPANRLRAEIPLIGREHLDAALAKGRGAIALSAHLGNFFLLGTRLAADEYANSVLVNQPESGFFGRFMDHCRTRLKQRTIHARPRPLAFLLLAQALRRNEIAVVIADEYRSGSGVFVPFFGLTVVARRGPATLALRTGAALVPIFLVRGADAGLRLVIEPEIEVARSGRIKADVRENSLRIVQCLERMVRAHPEQWNWMNVHWHRPSPGAVVGKEPRFERLA